MISLVHPAYAFKTDFYVDMALIVFNDTALSVVLIVLLWRKRRFTVKRYGGKYDSYPVLIFFCIMQDCFASEHTDSVYCHNWVSHQVRTFPVRLYVIELIIEGFSE